MSFIDEIKIRAKADKKTIVLPEAMDSRILKATEIILSEEIANIVLIKGIPEIGLNIPTIKYAITRPTISPTKPSNISVWGYLDISLSNIFTNALTLLKIQGLIR